MYPHVLFDGISWPITQHSGIITEDVVRGLINACLELNGHKVDTGSINDYIVSHGIVTDNYRSDSNKLDAWRDYQQILSELGLIYSTKICERIILTPVAIAFADGEISYKELITLQVLKYQYPNGHKTQISPSLRRSYEESGKPFAFSSFAEMQASSGILLRPVVLIWQVLYKLYQMGEEAILSIDEMQRYVVRCQRNTDIEMCVETIIRSRHTDYQLAPMVRARRNLQDWIKIMNETPLFYSDYKRNCSLSLSHYSIEEAESINAICKHLCKPETFWLYTNNANSKIDWYDFYGSIDIGTDWIPNQGYENIELENRTNATSSAEVQRSVELQDFKPMVVSEPDTRRKVVSIYDYKKSIAGHMQHDNMVNLIASKCISKGALVSFDPKTVDLYIRYKTKEFIVEVKSITPSNFIQRLRTAIGQVHQYDYIMHQKNNGRGRLGLAFTANIPKNNWSIPFITNHMDMDLLCMDANSLFIKSNYELSLELYG